MIITSTFLQNEWKSITYKDGGYLQIDVIHPLEWFVGYQSRKQKTLLLIGSIESDEIKSSKSILVTRRKRETDNRNVLSFELLHNEQNEVFATFCADIIEYSRKATDEKSALNLVVRRYKQWSCLLEAEKLSFMDEKCRKGLLGELLFIQERIKSSGSILKTIQGWVGPNGADQDFIFEDVWYEIKSIDLAATSITISSLEQLDTQNTGELVVMRIDKSAPEKMGAISLNDAVSKIDCLLSDIPEAFDLFHLKLSNYGYIDLKEYSMQKYYCSKIQRYDVNDTFPRMLRRKVPSQIESLHYELSLPALENWLKR
ncbi:MAG: PD-(D/E)XK motif protein [Spirochaetia bacterium]|jgi:hypothetical protein|nr:PD-(D/E)XK motif protein [Spirochaetia bacterium]